MSSAVKLTLPGDGRDGSEEVALDVRSLVIAGWTGRDGEAIEKHIAELEAIGVPRPKRVPCFYRVAAALLTTAAEIEVPGETSSGEVEFVLFASPGGMLVGVGSDHTDRQVETYSITVSKQMCAKPIAPEAWRYADVADHWDELILRSWAVEDGVRRLYQEGTVAGMRTPEDLIGRQFDGARELPAGTAMFCGTHAVHGEIASAGRFEFEIEDPVLNRSIRHGYDLRSLPIED
jgi:hypothetical protein